METKKLCEVKKGEFFRLRESETAPVWVNTGGRIRRGGMSKYECQQYEDINHYNYFPPDKIVYVGFTY